MRPLFLRDELSTFSQEGSNAELNVLVLPDRHRCVERVGRGFSELAASGPFALSLERRTPRPPSGQKTNLPEQTPVNLTKRYSLPTRSLIRASNSFRTIHQQRLVATGEKVTEQLLPPFEAAGVGAQKPFHARDQIRLGRLDHQMKTCLPCPAQAGDSA